MCKDCCGLRQIEVNQTLLTDHVCGVPSKKEPVFHVGFFTLYREGPIFPGEVTRLDACSACNLHLMADVRTTGLRPPEHFDQDRIPYDGENENNPNKNLLRNIFAVAPNCQSKYGALVQCNVVVQRRTASWNMYSNFEIKVLARYKLVSAEVPIHRPYSCILVSVLCDEPFPSLSDSIDNLFPVLSPFRFPRKNGGNYGIMTRSRSAIRRTLPRQRSSVLMAGLPYKVWNAFQPESLKQRARKAFSSVRFPIRYRHRQIEPKEDDCAVKWSYYLSAILPHKVPPISRSKLFEISSLNDRYNLLLKIFDEYVKTKKLKLKVKARGIGGMSARKIVSHTIRKPKIWESKPKQIADEHDSNHIQSCIRHQVVEEILKNRPWPTSSGNGFCNVNLVQPCKGRFKLLPPHFAKEESDYSATEKEDIKF